MFDKNWEINLNRLKFASFICEVETLIINYLILLEILEGKC